MRRDPADQAVRDHAATALNCNVFLDAGAGCGKTQALTARYLSLLRSGIEVPEIVAVTFTNKAARDMKARLRGECEKQALAAEEGDGALWLRRARQLENAPISTIHAFCTSLLRRYALRAGLDPQFAVMDEVQNALLLRETLRRGLLDRLDADEPAAALAVDRMGLQGALGAITRLVRAREERQSELDHPPSAPDLLRRWEEMRDEIIAQRLNLLVKSPAWQKHAATLITCKSTDAHDRLECLRGEIVELIAVVEDRETAPGERIASLSCVFDFGQVPSKGSGWSEDHQAAVAEACRCFKNKGKQPSESIRELCDNDANDPTPAAELTAAVYQEAHHGLRAFQAAKANESLLDYEDLQILVRDLLATNAQVRRDCHSRYRHVLIDEFQDTNALQRDLLWLVAGGEPGAGSPPAAPAPRLALPPPGRLFIVGDAKQSIYRFRDADVTVFDEVREAFSTDGYESARLSVTFRSHPALAGLHNVLFADPRMMGADRPSREPYEAFYETLQAHREGSGEHACCNLVLAQSATAEGADELRETEARALAAWLRESIGKLQVYMRGEDGEEVARPCKPGDVALLFRSMSSVRLYERALRLEGLRYHISSGRGFFSRQETLDLTNLLAALENWRDEVALAGALRSPLFGLSDETLYWLKQDCPHLANGLKQVTEGKHPFQQFLDPREAELVTFAWQHFGELRGLKNRLPLTALLNEIVGRTGYTAALAGLYDGDQQIGNVRKLIEIAGAFEASGHYSLRDFIDYLRDLTTTEERVAQAPVVEEQADCIKLMTVHAAKGLEWPVVVVPDLAHDSANRGGRYRYHRKYGLVAGTNEEGEQDWPPVARLMRDLEQAEELAERKRLLYVALTRCRDRLVLSSAVGHREGETWYNWLRETIGLDVTSSTCELPGIAVQVVDVDDLPAQRPVKDAAPQPAEVDPEQLRRRLRAIPPDVAHRQHFTVTALSDYRRCPAYYHLRYVAGCADQRGLGGPGAGGSLPATERGEIIHRALELIGRDGLPEAEAALRQALGWRIVQDDNFAQMLGRIEWYLRQDVYLNSVATANTLRSEVPVVFRPDDAIIEGKIDAVAEGAALCALDFKTGYETEGEADADHVFQLGLYCAALQSLGKAVGGACVVYLDRQALVEVSDQDIATATGAAAEAIAGIRTGAFEAAPGHGCERCGVRWACSRASL